MPITEDQVRNIGAALASGQSACGRTCGVLASRYATRADFGAGALRRGRASHSAGNGEAQNSLQNARERRILLLDSRPSCGIQRQAATTPVEDRHQTRTRDL